MGRGGGGVLSKIPDFHGQFKKKILVSGISRSISKIFFQREAPDPPAYAYALTMKIIFCFRVPSGAS
jgi:hypothetical protein